MNWMEMVVILALFFMGIYFAWRAGYSEGEVDAMKKTLERGKALIENQALGRHFGPN